jgi:hypothetical protein
LRRLFVHFEPPPALSARFRRSRILWLRDDMVSNSVC